ncbi:MAG: hypothetical protein FJ215_00715 [Ignavibacteria bacterium]|nr:hypothetical protein [Ignavibacteria bacterium]
MHKVIRPRAGTEGSILLRSRQSDPREALDESVEAGMEVKIDPVQLYAVRKTGMILTEENAHLFSDEDLREWEKAVEQGRRLLGSGVNRSVNPGSVGQITKLPDFQIPKCYASLTGFSNEVRSAEAIVQA